jgi:O-antigen/teichoic acid export membrane protein
VGALGGVASGAISAIFPYSSQLNVTSNGDEIKNLFLQSSRIFIAILFPVVVFISLFSYQILTIWMGKEFAGDTWLVLSVISFSSLIGSLSSIPNLIILGLGNSKLLGIFSLITIVLYIIFIPILTKLFGINGTAVALLLTSAGVIYYVIIKTTEFIHIKIKEYYRVVLKPHVGILFIAIVLFPIVMMMKSQHIIITISIGAGIMFLHYLYLIKLKIIPFGNIYNKLFQKA